MIVVGTIFTVMFVFAVLLLCFGALMFQILGEGKYFTRYLALNGYYPFLNVVFLLDYLMMGIGSLGIPFLLVGFVTKSNSR